MDIDAELTQHRPFQEQDSRMWNADGAVVLISITLNDQESGYDLQEIPCTLNRINELTCNADLIPQQRLA